MNLQESIEQAKPMLRWFFDITANNGWNLVAIANYMLWAALVIAAIYKHKERR